VFTPIYCCGCKMDVVARQTNGKEIYPHRPDLHHLPFWKCDQCGNYVGCHHRSEEPLTPLGVIPTPGLRQLRQEIHRTLDPLWKSRRVKRAALYRNISDRIGWRFHTAKLRSMDEARKALSIIKSIEAEINEREQRIT